MTSADRPTADEGPVGRWLESAGTLVLAAFAAREFAAGRFGVAVFLLACLSLAGWLVLALLPRRPGVVAGAVVVVAAAAGAAATPATGGLTAIAVIAAVMIVTADPAAPGWAGPAVAALAVAFTGAAALLSRTAGFSVLVLMAVAPVGLLPGTPAGSGAGPSATAASCVSGRPSPARSRPGPRCWSRVRRWPATSTTCSRTAWAGWSSNSTPSTRCWRRGAAMTPDRGWTAPAPWPGRGSPRHAAR